MSSLFGHTAGQEWLSLDNDYFHKVPLFHTDWPFTVPSLQPGSFSLQGLHAVCSENGGPIFLVRDENATNKCAKDFAQKIRIFTSAGTLLSEFPWKHTDVVAYGWTYKETIAAVTGDGTVYIYNTHGKEQSVTLIDPPGDENSIAGIDVKVSIAKISKFGVACTFSTHPGQIAFFSFAKNTTTWYQPLPQSANITSIAQIVPGLTHIDNADYTAQLYTEQVEDLLADLNSDARYRLLPKIVVAIKSTQHGNNKLVSNDDGDNDNVSTSLYILGPNSTMEKYNVVGDEINTMVVDSSQQFIALWSNNNMMSYCYSLQNSTILYNFKLKSKRLPQQILFLGSSSLLAPTQNPDLTGRQIDHDLPPAPKLFFHWNINEKSVAMVVSHSAFRSYNWSTPTIVYGEPDYSVRVISQQQTELIQCLHPDIIDILRKDATSPATTLISSFLQFKSNHLQSDVLLRRLIDTNQLEQAIRAVLSAACHCLHEPTQTLLFQVCSYGRTYIDPDHDISSDSFVDACKNTRLLFNLRTTKLGVPLTYTLLTQYFTAELIVLRMTSYQQHAIAVKLSTMLKIPADVVILDWCLVKLLHSGDLNDLGSQFGLGGGSIVKKPLTSSNMNPAIAALTSKLSPVQHLVISMSSKLQLCRSRSYVSLALSAAKNNQLAVAIALAHHEPLITHQTSLFMAVQEFNSSIKAAYLSNDYELLVVTLMRIYDKMAHQKTSFFQTLHLYPDIEFLWLQYLKKNQWDLYLEYSQSIPGLVTPASSTAITIQHYVAQIQYQLYSQREGESGSQPQEKKSTQQLLSNFKQLSSDLQADKTNAAASGLGQLVSEQETLLQLQNKYIASGQLNADCLGLSLIETIQEIYSSNQEPLVNMFKDLFKLTDQRLAYVHIPILVDREDWTTLQAKSGQFANILGGFEFIIETLVDAKHTQQAVRYLDLVPKNGKTFNWLVGLGLDVEGLRQLRSHVGNQQQPVLDRLITEMTQASN